MYCTASYASLLVVSGMGWPAMVAAMADCKKGLPGCRLVDLLILGQAQNYVFGNSLLVKQGNSSLL